MTSKPANATFTFRQCRAGEVSLHVAEIGNGPPILFLHGFPEHWRAFAPMMTNLADDFRCMAPDQRGFGQSDRPLDLKGYKIDQLADDIAHLIGALGQTKVHVVAHDWGGLVAWHFASRHPDLLDRLIIFNAPHPFCLQTALDQDPAQRLASHYAEQFSQQGYGKTLAARGPEALWAAFFGADEAAGWMSASDKAVILANWAQPNAWLTMLNWYRAAEFDYSGRCDVKRIPPPKIRAPTLLIWGQQDPLFEHNLLSLHHGVVADLRIEAIEDGGHSVFRQYPQKSATLVRDFLTRRPAL